MNYYFKLQLIRFHRHLAALKLPIAIGYIMLTAVFIGFTIILFNITDYAPYIYTGIAVSFLIKINQSQKQQVLKLNFTKKVYRNILKIEHFIVALPFAISLGLINQFILSFSLIIVAYFLSYVEVKSVLNKTIYTPFYKRPFEYLVGFRKTIPALIFAYFLAVMAIKANNFNLGIFSILLVSLITISYYSWVEHEFYVWLNAHSPRQFLLKKIMTALSYNVLLNSPLILCFSYTFNEHFLIIIGTIILGFLYLISVILSKYAIFPSKLDISQSFLILFSFISPPLLLFLIPHSYFKAVKNLKYYLP